MITAALRLALRHARWNWPINAVLVLSLALLIFLPLGLQVITDTVAAQWRARADQTPLVIGPRGSRVDLVLHALYHQPAGPDHLRFADAEAINASSLANAIPVYTRHSAQGYPIVGTSSEYFVFRNLDLGRGEPLTVIGEAVLGHQVARELSLNPGDFLITDPENPFHIAAAYPLKLRVVGIFQPTGSPDDSAVFVDPKTAWIISGIGHGHEDLENADAENTSILSRESNRVVANASLEEYVVITPENIASFHFHAADQDLPLTAIIALPTDKRAETILRGRYLSPGLSTQALKPAVVVEDLLTVVFRTRTLAQAALILIALGTGALLILVVALSQRLRLEEMQSLRALGASRGFLFAVVASELIGVLALAALMALAGVWAMLRLLPMDQVILHLGVG